MGEQYSVDLKEIRGREVRILLNLDWRIFSTTSATISFSIRSLLCGVAFNPRSTSNVSSSSSLHYSPGWTLASSKTVLQCSRSCNLHFQFITSMFFTSSSTDSNHLNTGFPTCRVPSGLCRTSSLQGSSSRILNGCPGHLNHPNFITLCLIPRKAYKDH